MLAQVHVTNSYSFDPKTRRKRARSSGSSSVSSYDLPKTPVDAYSHEDRIGSAHSVSKMNHGPPNPAKSAKVQRELKTYQKGSKVRAPTKALPMWLASTFSTLEPKHPLRELLPPLAHEDMIEVRTRNEPRPCSQEARNSRVFAFSPFDADVKENNDAAHDPPFADPAFCDIVLLPRDPTTANAELQTSHLREDTLDFCPFSTPGSLVALQHAVNSNASSDLARPSGSQKTLVHVKPPLLSHDASVNRANFTSPPVFRPTITGPENYLTSFRRRSAVTSNDRGPYSPAPDFQENALTMNIFSTPGPAFTVSRPVYFDSPTEDPSLSESLEPESYELDLDALDFRWQPFLRKTLPDPSLAGRQTYDMHASATIPPVFDYSDVLLPRSPHSFCSVAENQVAMAEARGARDLYDRSVRGSPVSGHAIRQISSPQSNGQSGAVVFAHPFRSSITVPPVSADPDVLSSHSPNVFRSATDDQATMAEASNAPIEYDLRDGSIRDSPIFRPVMQGSPSPQLNGQNVAVIFAPTSGISVSPLRGATSSPMVPGIGDVHEVSPHETKLSYRIQIHLVKAYR
ncbi:uncharacterized protein EDB93DRAFT_1132008 [Suillus bovinus]|uniref:uncharacterized protein n=1 Tax=Suillus bovinus TaxID=48563 RepID=UPI001B86D302|nr:uncharacterized protein EDB93DRAFT_1132008 [Suillus bovinus]KAG2154398.1 hypothetical protein EDB93DRAFT_1132008 [Suillus bovinus]